MIIAGEVSGDIHGASLIRELKKLDSSLEIFGIGGDLMKDAGMKIIYHINRMAFLGFVEVIKHIPFIRKVRNDLLEVIKEKNVKSVVLIDYPGFNLSIAKRVKRLGVKIIYYISPQIWAWGSGRINKIKNLVTKMLVVFPFEENLYKQAGVDVEFVGHPLPERIKNYKFLSKDELWDKFGLNKSKEILLILPGSRNQEVEKIFPDAIAAAEKLSSKFNLQVVTACSSNIDEKILSKISGSTNNKIIKGFTYDLLKYSKIGIVKSGTSTLEAALFQLPMVIVYKTNYLTYLIGKNLIKVDNIGMANIIAGEKVAPELIQNKADSNSIYYECEKILSDNEIYQSIKNKLSKVKDKLGTDGASARAAKAIYAILNES